METIYINKKTKGIINPSSILHNDDEKIIVTNTNCWQLIPKKDIEIQNTYSEYFPEERIPQPMEFPDAALIDPDFSSNTYTHKAIYEFGFKDFSVCTRYPNGSSGIISKTISVDNTDYISLDAEISGEEHGSVEFWIIDGISEIPILPKRSKTVQKEKLFYGLNTRFPIDLVQGITPVIYEDDIVTGKDYTLLTAEDFLHHTYCMTYTAAGDPYACIPASQKVRIKIIVRQYDNVPVRIDHVVVYRHGGSVIWNSTQPN